MAITVPTERKQLGAFYTPPRIAEILAEWAVRSPDDRVFDPSFGGLALLDAAGARLCELGAAPESVPEQLSGCEVDGVAFDIARAKTASFSTAPNLVHSDFFALRAGDDIARAHAVLGNPPYVRAHLADGAEGRRVAGLAGVELGGMSSSWAAFTVHATSFVAPGGRMGFILPSALIHAQYATGVVAFLRRSFRRLIVVLFEQRVFPGVLEEVVLVLAEGKGEGEADSVEIVECRDIETLDLDLVGMGDDPQPPPGGHEFELEPSFTSALDQLLPSRTRQLLRDLEHATEVERLGERATIELGVVTGANDFFLPSAAVADALPPDALTQAIGRASHIPGARFTKADMRALMKRGARCRLLAVPHDAPESLLKALEPYIATGKARNLTNRNKCRTRDPWWSVPLPKSGPPDLFLTYCAAAHPRLVANDAEVLSTNALHGVRIRRGKGRQALAAGFVNSLTLLSAEREGRSYGGGVLKLEPTEAHGVMLPPLVRGLGKLVGEVDRLVREGNLEATLDLVDPLVLGKGLGLEQHHIDALRAGHERLRSRRRARQQPPV